MPNYRYNMPEYERRSNMGRSRAACAALQSSCENARRTCEVPYRECRNTEEMSCAVSDRYDDLSEMALAMAYVPWQMWRKVYDAEKGFCRGTIFEELDKPFRGMGGVR